MEKGKNPNVWLAMSMFLLMMVSTAAAQTIYVDVDATGVNDGSSWDNAYKYLQDALIAAEPTFGPVEIRVAEGLYKPDQGGGITPGDRTATFQLTNGVAIKGCYGGFGEPDPNTRDIDKYETILSGDLDGNDVDVNDPADLLYEPTRGENSYQVVTGSGIDETATLEGFTINGGNANDHPLTWHHMGGGMYCRTSGSLTVTKCTFRRNSALIGGGIGNWESSPTVSNCKFVGNAVSSEGGGMGNSHSSPKVTDCTFSRNWAGGGGGMHNYYGSPVLTNCNFIGNSAAAGGGMSNLHSSPTVTGCTFSGNSTRWGGGGMFNNAYNRPALTNCTFSGNSAEERGGAMANDAYNNVMLANCTFVGNIAPNGNALACDSSRQRWMSNLELTNCILRNGGDEVWNNDGSTIAITYSDLQGGQTGVYDPCEGLVWGAGNIDADPLFADPNNGDYHLKSQAGRWEPSSQSWVVDEVTSPCIDAGDPKSPIGYEPFPNGGIINMGAYGGTPEASKSYFGQPVCQTPVAGDINGDCKVNFLDFRIMALHWLEER